jgi:cell division septal protein FtsQ
MSKKRRIILGSDIRRKKNIFGKIFFWLAFIIFFGTLIYMVFFSGYLTISSISIRGTQDLKNEDILSKVESSISGQYFGYIPKNNLLLFGDKKIASDLENSYKKIDRIITTKKFPSSLVIEITEHVPALIICSQEECFYSDDQGKVFMRIDPSSEEVTSKSLINFIDEGNKDINEGDIVVKPDLIDYLLKIRSSMKVIGETDILDNFATPAFISRDIRAMTNEGWEIFFNADISLSKEADMLKVVLDEKVPSEKRSHLEYIDLRSDNKVFYKFKDDYQEEQKNKEENSASEKDVKKKKK